MSPPKEPKYWLCDDSPPPAWRGPGDAHSQQEWVWRRQDYESLFEDPERRPVRGESTPFYLWSRGAHRRIAEGLPEVRLIAVVRDPRTRSVTPGCAARSRPGRALIGLLNAFRVMRVPEITPSASTE